MKQLVYFLLFIPFLFSCGNDEEVKPASISETIHYSVENLSTSSTKVTLYYTDSDGGTNIRDTVEYKTVGPSETWEKAITPEKKYKLLILSAKGSTFRMKVIKGDYIYDKTTSINTSVSIETQL